MLQLSQTRRNKRPASELVEPTESARAAGLRHVVDTLPGLRRRRVGRGFCYLDPDGNPIRDTAPLNRIKALAIPPAWIDVWISPDPKGHLQATGFDVKGRKQYRYHPRWREARDAVKYERMVAFGEALSKIRERTGRDLSLPGMPREKVLAVVVQLLESTLIRVGNEEYRRQNSSFGLTTLQDEHVKVAGSTVKFQFRGKSGKQQEVQISDRRLARVVRQCQEIPGQELFQYLDESGEARPIESGDVNDYLRASAEGDFTAKDFRTWHGSVLAARLLRECQPCTSERECRRQITAVIKRVAAQLNNTPAVCRKCYVHPIVLEAYRRGSLAGAVAGGAEATDSLSPEEQTLLNLLRGGERVIQAAT